MTKETNPWEKECKIIDTLPGGGQCFNYIVTMEGKQGELFVLKVIKDKSKKERRARFYREAHNYISLANPCFPEIVSHNCNESPDIEKKLFLVYKFIEGVNLEEFISNNGKLNFIDAIKFTLLLADILELCHQNDIIHRDIKPDNILLKGGDLNQPILIDFGLSASETDDNESEHVQIGNRFLHLDELKYSEGNKRDKRSDITYLVGIFYYILTAKKPVVLFDGNNRYPHQRVDLKSIVNEANPNQLAIILKIFDIGFQHQLNSRFQSLQKFKSYLNQILMANNENEFDFEKFLKDSSNESLKEVENSLNKMYPEFRLIFEMLPKTLTANFNDIEVGVSGPSVLPHWRPMCIAGHYYLTEKFERETKSTYVLKLYPNGVEYMLALVIDDKETTIDRFQDIAELDKESTSNAIYKTIARHFALLKKENTGKQSL